MTEKSTLRKIFLLPLARLYGLATTVRNRLFDWGIKKQTEFDVPVVAIGNLAVGGTGKTPHTEYIVNLLRNRYNIGILSRGYKRHTKGFVLATPHSTPRDIGDESYQMYHKFGRRIMVAVCEKRVEGIRKMLEVDPTIDLILLDDGFQHRYVKPKVSILLTEFTNPYYQDDLLPYGRLRESAKGAMRADIVIVTKCPAGVKAIDYRLFKKHLDLIPAQDLFFSHYHYDAPRAVFPGSVRPDTVPALDRLGSDYCLLAVSGIGNPRPFVRYVKSFKPRVKVNVFPDHHDYTRRDMELLTTRFESMPPGKRFILTTEKDAVRLINNPYFPHKLKPYIFFIPVRVDFEHESNMDFEESLVKFINSRSL